MFTATPQEQKTISKLGFELYPIAEAFPLRSSKSSVQDWGSYYETKPMVVAGHLSDAMDTINSRSVLRGMLSLYQNRIDVMANLISNQARNPVTNDNDFYAQHYFAA